MFRVFEEGFFEIFEGRVDINKVFVVFFGGVWMRRELVFKSIRVVKGRCLV